MSYITSTNWAILNRVAQVSEILDHRGLGRNLKSPDFRATVKFIVTYSPKIEIYFDTWHAAFAYALNCNHLILEGENLRGDPT